MFSTIVNLRPSPLQIGYNAKIMAMGSCFSENIGVKLKDSYFNVISNPFGILFNPSSISSNLRNLLNKKEFDSNDFFKHGSLWCSFAHSNLLSDVDFDRFQHRINNMSTAAATFLEKTDFLLITFGTAWVFENVETGRLVANCHKLPASRFLRRRLSVEEIVDDYMSLVSEMRLVNPDLKIIFTVSPVRHWKDGAHENNISKSTLHLAVDTLCNQLENVEYYPAYELLMDELRDYRFYADDMCHPSDLAIQYIWQRFTETYFSDITRKIYKELAEFYSQLNHRPIHPDSKEYLLFKQKLENKQIELIDKYPFLKERI